MSHLKNSLLYRVKYLWYSILAFFLKGSRTYFTGKKLKYKFLKEGIKPSVKATSTMSQQNKKMASHLGEHRYKPFDNNLLRLQTIKNLISNPFIKVVSFDIFDTLLFRPCFYPTDLFYLLANKVNKLYHIDFISLRLHAEDKMQNPYASLADIYHFIKKNYKLNSTLVHRLYEEELACEKQLLAARKDIFSIYEYAVSKGKRVIAVSDMYLSSKFLQEVLQLKGYSSIEKVYVSNEYSARKDEGTLFNKVLEQEKIAAHEMLHIGDNKKSDFEIPFNKNIPAVYYPSIKDIIFQTNSIYSDMLHQHPSISQDPLARTLISFALFEEFQNILTAPKGPRMWDNIQQFTNIVLGPVVFYVAHYIATNPQIQQDYDRVHFAARDGFLPKIAYDILSTHIKTLPSNYLYASRRAYFPLFYDSLEQFIRESMNFDMLDSLTFEDLLTQIIIDKQTLQAIKQKLPSSILQSLVKHNLENCLATLKNAHNEIQHYLSLMRTRATAYYRKQLISTTGREIVFDLGYSGSISNALTKIVGVPVDKIYFWSTSTNIQRDKNNSTKTFCLFDENTQRQRIQLLYEELFSPLTGSALGFNQNLAPVLEKISFSCAMKKDFRAIKNTTEVFMKSACERFGKFLPYLSVEDPEAFHTIILYMLEHSPYAETSLFKDIIFPDPLACDTNMTLESKLSIQRKTHVFDGTGFDNPANYISFPKEFIPFHGKIGIHIHVFYVDLLQELLVYLEQFPYPFDLYITFPQSLSSSHVIGIILNKYTLPNVQTVKIFPVENRGRDVAPWLITIKPYQNKYDLFCHLHTKKSIHFSSMGTDWRKYLYRSLLSPQAIQFIFSSFANESKIGLLFPKPYSQLAQLCIEHNIPQEGDFGEITIINKLINKMGINRTFCYNSLFFSEGTMFWYRPKALKSLFDLNLKYFDFPEEPIGVGGTIAHAIERLPAFVCEAEGYQAKSYAPKIFEESL